MADVLAHELTLTVRVPEWVPGHEERGHDMPDYQHNRQTIIDDGHYFCWRCAIAKRTPKTELQCHHLSEWAEWNDADHDKALAIAKFFDPYGYAKKIGESPITTPNDIRLLWFQCQECHTGAPKDPVDVTTEPTDYISGGIHYCTLVDWLADAVRVRKAIEAQEASA